MKVNKIPKEYCRRLVAEGIINSSLAGVAFAAAVNLVFAALYWTLGVGRVILGVAIGLPLGAVFGVIIYLIKYRLTDGRVARRIDRLGLRERMITMVELSGDESTVAEMQRADALEHLLGVSPRSIRIRLSRLFSVLSAVLLSVSVGFTVLAILAGAGRIPYGRDLIDTGVDGSFDVAYSVEGDGYILGKSEQSVELGGSAEIVRAVASDGWMFVGWSDGESSPERRDTDVRENLEFTARFKKIDASDPDDEDGDSADDLPEGSVIEESGGGNSDQTGGDNIKDDGSGGGGGKWQDRNQFIDGMTYYRDYLELYYSYATGIFEADSDIPPEVIEFFETYFKGI